jgi:fructose-1,6-bisphosphatase/inositol monophosphatase family enzyme
MNAIWTAEHPHACYFKFSKPQEGGGSLWDYAATSCIFKELGIWASDINGNKLELNSKKSSFMNQCGVLHSNQVKLKKMIQAMA